MKPVLVLFETASIGNPIMVTPNLRFINRCNQRHIGAVSKNAGIRSPIVAFYNYRYRLGLSFFLINLILETILFRHFKSAGIGLLTSLMGKTYPNAFGSVGIGSTYPSTFKSVGIRLLHSLMEKDLSQHCWKCWNRGYLFQRFQKH